MQIRKAVITAAGRSTGQNPAGETVLKAMLPVVDRDGTPKPVLQIIAEEALDSGIEEVCVVAAPGDEQTYRQCIQGLIDSLRHAPGDTAASQEQIQRLLDLDRRLRFAVQERPEGYGHAVWCAREFVGNEPFLLLVSDHLYVSGEQRRCARQILDLASQENCAVAAVQATREHLIGCYGTVAGKRLTGQPHVLQIEEIIEKPHPSVAEQRLHVPGLRVGHYLCLFGMQVLTPTLFAILDAHVKTREDERTPIQLTPALRELARRERYLALQTVGRRHDIGVKYGLLEAQIALAMAGVDRDHVLARLVELLVQFEQDRSGDAKTGPGGPAQASA
ncbi:MAG: NTP transferase domain-containing protein [Phycisphaerae bacterium]|nr:NTP transferase domain-containing protein [Phycisphaerae bacterium]